MRVDSVPVATLENACGCFGYDRGYLGTCSRRAQKTLFDLLGPVIDPIGYQIELESYVAKIMRGPANLYVGIVGYVGAALMFFHFFVDPHKALMVRCHGWIKLFRSCLRPQIRHDGNEV